MSSVTLKYQQQTIVCHDGESVLTALLREHIDIPHACQAGVCQSCKMQSLNAQPPADAQVGLSAVQKHQKHFLACLCYPQQAMHIRLQAQADCWLPATVSHKQLLNRDTLLLQLDTQQPLDFYAGQFVNLRRADGLMRSYSIANSRQHAQRLTFHIRRLAGGRFSAWAHEELATGDSIQVSEPQGLCYYLPNAPEQNLLLIGTGSGLAPLAGIVSEALQQGHSGEICLYHGSREIDGLYWIEEMRELAEQHPNFHYTPCISRGDVPTGFSAGRANQVALNQLPNLQGWRVFLCGHPDMVNETRRQVYLQGAKLQDIHADAFHVASSTLD